MTLKIQFWEAPLFSCNEKQTVYYHLGGTKMCSLGSVIAIDHAMVISIPYIENRESKSHQWEKNYSNILTHIPRNSWN